MLVSSPKALLSLSLSCAVLAACGDDTSPTDAGPFDASPPNDQGVRPDTGDRIDTGVDAGGSDVGADGGGADASDLGVDSGPPPLDGCPPRQWMTGTSTNAACACLPQYTGANCESCAPGYAGPDCLSCAAGFRPDTRTGVRDVSDEPTVMTPALVLMDFRCVSNQPEVCPQRACRGRGTCSVIEGEAICQCDVGYTGEDCGECAPDFEIDPTGGSACILGDACRRSLCGDKGDCAINTNGDVACRCDVGGAGPTCGGPDITIDVMENRRSMTPGGSLVLLPSGGRDNFTVTVTAGRATVSPCPTGGATGCPDGGFRVTADPNIVPEGLDLITISVSEATLPAPEPFEVWVTAPDLAPFTGDTRAELEPFYERMTEYMRARGIRAGVLGIAKGGRVLSVNGFGRRNPGIDDDPFDHENEAGSLVQPDTPFRLASNSKPITAAAVRARADERGIDITSTAMNMRAVRWIQQSTGLNLASMPSPAPYNASSPDMRWQNLTVQDLINHNGGYWRDMIAASTGNLQPWTTNFLANTMPAPGESGTTQTDRSFSNTSGDLSYATMYILSALQQTADPRPTVFQTIRFLSGVNFDYAPGGSVGAGDNYSNLGYIMLGRVLEGLQNRSYDPDAPNVPEGWGPYIEEVQDYLCNTSGITASELFGGSSRAPDPREPYYRHFNDDGTESMSWNVASSEAIRFNAQAQIWEFCQELPTSDCDEANAVWNTNRNAPSAYGGVWLAQRNSAGGLVATAGAMLKFARLHRVRAGSPNDGASGAGSLLAAPGAHLSGSSHSGSLPGTRTLVWQMSGGDRNVRIPLSSGAWKSNPNASLETDPLDGNKVLVDENFGSTRTCALPDDVTVVALFNQRTDRRTPSNASTNSNSTASAVYGRITDFLADAACDVEADGWPVVSYEGNVLAQPPVCP